MMLHEIRFDQIVPLILKQKAAQAKSRGRTLRLRKPPKPRSVKGLQRDYLRALRPILELMRQVITESVLPMLGPILQQAKNLRPKADLKQDDFQDDIDRAMSMARIQFLRRYTPEEIAVLVKKQADKIDMFNAKEMDRTFGAVLGIDLARVEPWLPTEIKTFTKQNVSLIKSIPEQYFDRVEQTVIRGVSQGKLGADIADEIEQAFGISESRAALIARDQASKFNGTLNQLRQTAVGIKQYTWSTCVDPDTEVVALDPKKLIRREYRGPMIEIMTGSGLRLRVTPDHKILTGRGWIRSDSLKNGDQLFRYIPEIEKRAMSSRRPLAASLGTGQPSAVPDINNVPSKISQIFATADKPISGPRRVSRMMHFDGERRNGYVDIVAVNSELLSYLKARCPKTVRKFALKLSDLDLESLLCDSSRHQSFFGFFSPSTFGSTLLGNLQSIFRRFFRNPKSSSLRTSSNLDPKSSKGIHDCVLGTSKMLRQDPRRHPGSILFSNDLCIGIRRKNSLCHVYDVTTTNGWMIANSFIVHNSSDERVRSNHAELDGTVQSWDDPPMGGGTSEDETGHPSSGIACRCSSLPIFEGFEE